LQFYQQLKLHALYQGFSNCSKHTTSGTPATVQWYIGLVRKNQRIKKKFSEYCYIENLFKLFLI
jgi:hypothetical protein